MKQKLAILSTLLLWLFVVSSCEEEVLEVIPQEITLSSFQREINPLEDENLMQILHDKKAIPDGFTAGRSDQIEGMLDLSTAMITYDEESGITRYSLRVFGSDPYYFTNVIFTKKEDAVEGYAIRFYPDPEWFENNDFEYNVSFFTGYAYGLSLNGDILATAYLENGNGFEILEEISNGRSENCGNGGTGNGGFGFGDLPDPHDGNGGGGNNGDSDPLDGGTPCTWTVSNTTGQLLIDCGNDGLFGTRSDTCGDDPEDLGGTGGNGGGGPAVLTPPDVDKLNAILSSPGYLDLCEKFPEIKHRLEEVLEKLGAKKSYDMIKEMINISRTPISSTPLLFITLKTFECDGMSLEELHLLLDGAGLIPVVGPFFDGVNGIIYVVEGDYLNAGFSAIAIVPVIGAAGVAGKYTVKALQSLNKGQADKLYQFMRNAGKTKVAALMKNITKLPAPLMKKFIQDLVATPALLKEMLSNPKLVDAWKKLESFPALIRKNLDNLKQRGLIDEHALDISKSSNARKGNFGEIGADLDLNTKNYQSLQKRIDDIDSPGHNGIDGVYRAPNGDFIIVEGKFSGSASLNGADLTTGLPRQMSDMWIKRPGALSDALGGDDVLARSIIRNGYKRVLAKVAPDGTVTYRLIDSKGFVIRGNAGNFNP